MTRDRIYEYFIEKDNNCAEAMLRALNDEYCLGIPDDSIKLVDGSGGGVGCGKAHGALYGGCSAVSCRPIHEKVHAVPELKPVMAASTEELVERFDPDAYCELIKTYKKEDTHRLDMICMVAGITDACFEGIIPEGRKQSK